MVPPVTSPFLALVIYSASLFTSELPVVNASLLLLAPQLIYDFVVALHARATATDDGDERGDDGGPLLRSVAVDG